MVRVDVKGLNVLLDFILETYSDDELEDRFEYLFIGDEELNTRDLCEYIYRHLNSKISSLDIYIEKSDVRYSENSDFEITNQALKTMVEKLNKKAETIVGKNDVEGLFGELENKLDVKDVSKFFARQIERMIRTDFEFNNFDIYIDF